MGKAHRKGGLAMKREATKPGGAPTADGNKTATRWNRTRKQVAELCQQYYKKKGSNSREVSEELE